MSDVENFSIYDYIRIYFLVCSCHALCRAGQCPVKGGSFEEAVLLSTGTEETTRPADGGTN